MYNDDLADVLKKYKTLKNKGYRTPIGDLEHSAEILELQLIDYNNSPHPLSKFIKNAIEKDKTLHQEQLLKNWAKSCHYGRLVKKYYPKIQFPALKQPQLEDWTWTMIRNCVEEQVHGFITNPLFRKRCRRGCNKEETTYHVTSACIDNEYTVRHDFVVFWILKYIMYNTEAPEITHSQLNYEKASIVATYNWKSRQLDLRAGTKIITNNVCYHNRPDIFIKLSNPDVIYLLEVSISHLQNMETQERIKYTRYAVNSKIQVTNQNLEQITRDFNIVEHLRDKYKCPVKLGIVVIGAHGEILETKNFQEVKNIFCELNINNKKQKILYNKGSVSAATSTAKIVIKRLKE